MVDGFTRTGIWSNGKMEESEERWKSGTDDQDRDLLGGLEWSVNWS